MLTHQFDIAFGLSMDELESAGIDKAGVKLVQYEIDGVFTFAFIQQSEGDWTWHRPE